MNKELEDYRDEIKIERRYVDKKPYSHNIINIILSIVAQKFGKKEANKAIRDFKLKLLGWNEEK